MKHYAFSPLAILCSLCVLYPPSDRTDRDVAALDTDFFSEEVPFEFLSEDWAKDSAAPLVLELETPEEGQNALSKTHLNKALLLADNQNGISPPATLKKNSSFFSIGGNYTYTHLKPHSHPSFTGSLGGMQGLYEFKPNDRFYEALNLRWKQGETKAHRATRFLVDVTAEERVGYTAATDKDKWIWTFFSGLGYRYLGHHLKQAGHGGMRFNYNDFYCPVGLFTDYDQTDYFSWGLHITWMPQFYSTVTLIPLKGARWKTDEHLGNILLEMPLSYHMGKEKQFFVTLNPLFQYWQDGRTTAVTSSGVHLHVPGNTYFFWGADLNIGYAF